MMPKSAPAPEMEKKKRQFSIWLGLPPEAREEGEKTQVDFAKKLGVHPDTLKIWKRDPAVQAVAQDALKILGGNKMLSVIHSLTDKAAGGDVQAMRLYMEWQGQIGLKRGTGLPSKFEVAFVEDGS